MRDKGRRRVGRVRGMQDLCWGGRGKDVGTEDKQGVPEQAKTWEVNTEEWNCREASGVAARQDGGGRAAAVAGALEEPGGWEVVRRWWWWGG